jgi:hypothetical protein
MPVKVSLVSVGGVLVIIGISNWESAIHHDVEDMLVSGGITGLNL